MAQNDSSPKATLHDLVHYAIWSYALDFRVFIQERKKKKKRKNVK